MHVILRSAATKDLSFIETVPAYLVRGVLDRSFAPLRMTREKVFPSNNAQEALPYSALKDKTITPTSKH